MDIIWLIYGARGETRTLTALQPSDFESDVSTIPPPGHLYLSNSFRLKVYKNLKTIMNKCLKVFGAVERI